MKITQVHDLWQYLSQTEKPIVLYGMGDGAEKVINMLHSIGKEASDFFASDGFVRGQLFHGKRVLTLKEVEEKYSDFIILQSFASSLPSVLEQIHELNARYEYYVPDVPVFGSQVFTYDFFKENEEKIKQLYTLFDDNESVAALDGIINYKLSGKIEYLKNTETDISDFVLSTLPTKKYRYYCDGGAYRGENSLQVLHFFPNLEEIYAFEPDPSSFKKLSSVQFPEKISTHFFNASLGESDGECEFIVCKSRASSLLSSRPESAVKKIHRITQYSLDSVLPEKSDIFIKLDVEGNELNALKGAEELIKSGSDMQISLYHKSEDIFVLPLYIASLYSEYKFYIRRIPYLPPWDISLFALSH